MARMTWGDEWGGWLGGQVGRMSGEVDWAHRGKDEA